MLAGNPPAPLPDDDHTVMVVLVAPDGVTELACETADNAEHACRVAAILALKQATLPVHTTIRISRI
jgi:hypothetical protein